MCGHPPRSAAALLPGLGEGDEHWANNAMDLIPPFCGGLTETCRGHSEEQERTLATASPGPGAPVRRGVPDAELLRLALLTSPKRTHGEGGPGKN